MKFLSIAALTVITLGASQSFAMEQTAGKTDRSEKSSQNVKISKINKNPSAWKNKRVTLQGEVEKIYPSGAFVLNGDGMFNDEILVVTQKAPAQTTAKEGDQVKITGQVRTLSVVEVERDYGFDLDPEVKIEFEGRKPVVVIQPDGLQKQS
jgi:uncharacterized protein YdeI (BOF family)